MRLRVEALTAGQIEAEITETVAADAGSLLDRIKAGLAWSLDALKAEARVGLESRLIGARHRREVALRTISVLDVEITRRQAVVAAIDKRINDELVNRALAEHARATLLLEYERRRVALRETATQLAALRPRAPWLMGPRAQPASVPVSRAEWQQANALWEKLAAAWLRNPKADPAKVLKFRPADPGATDLITYDRPVKTIY